MNKHPGLEIDWQNLLESIRQGDQRLLARAISYVENETPGFSQLLENLPSRKNPEILGITGPPGAGKSSLADALIGLWIAEGKKIAVICVDPSSPFHHGALLGDRIRMSSWYNHPQVYIRSVASRGALGGLNPKIIEITDLLGAGFFDRIIVETVGVGQNEVDIAGLADTTMVVLVPGTGDDIQAMKSGLFEIADIFVVNKADRPGVGQLVQDLISLSSLNEIPGEKKTPIIKTIATQKQGIAELAQEIARLTEGMRDPQRKSKVLAEKAYQLIIQKRMKDIDKDALQQRILSGLEDPGFNLYKMIANY